LAAVVEIPAGVRPETQEQHRLPGAPQFHPNPESLIEAQSTPKEDAECKDRQAFAVGWTQKGEPMLLPSANLVTRITGWILAFSLILLPPRIMGQTLPDNLFQRWIHSYEEDTEEAEVFRPPSYEFPPSRGREGFDIRKDGSFALLGPGRSDRSTAIAGHWVRSSDSILVVTFEENYLNRRIQIIEVKPQILRIKR
jgi:hypothetical protein